ncbi:MAG: hypothetical protein ABIJ92_01155 [Candidatus Aenigmatarchaeota archaeon]
MKRAPINTLPMHDYSIKFLPDSTIQVTAIDRGSSSDRYPKLWELSAEAVEASLVDVDEHIQKFLDCNPLPGENVVPLSRYEMLLHLRSMMRSVPTHRNYMQRREGYTGPKIGDYDDRIETPIGATADINPRESRTQLTSTSDYRRMSTRAYIMKELDSELGIIRHPKLVKITPTDDTRELMSRIRYRYVTINRSGKNTELVIHHGYDPGKRKLRKPTPIVVPQPTIQKTIAKPVVKPTEIITPAVSAPSDDAARITELREELRQIASLREELKQKREPERVDISEYRVKRDPVNTLQYPMAELVQTIDAIRYKTIGDLSSQLNRLATELGDDRLNATSIETITIPSVPSSAVARL